MRKYKNIFKNKRIIVTGHTGFKGSWLATWLILLGAKVTGISNNIPTNPSHFKYLKLKNKVDNCKLDIRNLKKLKKIFKSKKPDYVFHLAAQSLVKKSYLNPKYTLETNTIGTFNILESLKEVKKECVAVIITSDKVYKNIEIKRGYKENDVLGGKDPYSASKASAEIVIKSYIESFFPVKKTNVFIAVARAGNVIGGGDWSENRLIPDCVKSWAKNQKVFIRNPKSTRPWQHVLEAVWGYLLLAISLKENKSFHGEAFNFGPDNNFNHNVIRVVKTIKKYWQGISWTTKKIRKRNFYESNILKLNSNKAKALLKWRCALTFNETMKMVAEWYKNFYFNDKLSENFTILQIEKYQELLKKRKRNK
jgi:CDP-glucose 4,6-dehydratase